MLATLRVAPRLPSPSLRSAAIAPQVGTGKLVHQSNWKADFGQPAVMHFYSGPPMHLRSGVDNAVCGDTRASSSAGCDAPVARSYFPTST